MFPATPAGSQLASLLEAVASEDDLTWSLLEPYFNADFAERELVLLGARELRPLLQQVGVTRAGGQGELECTALVEAGGAGTVRVIGAVAPAPPHRLLGIDVEQRAAGATVLSWEEVTGSEPAPVTTSELPEDLTRRLDAMVDEQRADQRIPALIAAVADASGGLVWTRSVGSATLPPKIAVTTTTTIRTGSIGKTMTAAAVLQLVDRGLLWLDDPINRHLTSYRVISPSGEELTVRQLLTHTSGLGARPGVALTAPAGEKVPTLADFYGPELVGQGAPGSFTYSNDAYATLGQLVEDVSGQPFGDYMIEHVFTPLGMTMTSFLPDERVGTAMTGFEHELDDLVVAEVGDIIIRAAGSTLSTTQDMALYASAVHGRGSNADGRYLSESAFELLTSVNVTDVGLPGVKGCLGWFRVPVGSGDALWHNGGLPGANSELAVLPDLGLSVLVFANARVRDLDGLCFGLAAELSATKP